MAVGEQLTGSGWACAHLDHFRQEGWFHCRSSREAGVTLIVARPWPVPPALRPEEPPPNRSSSGWRRWLLYRNCLLNGGVTSQARGIADATAGAVSSLWPTESSSRMGRRVAGRPVAVRSAGRHAVAAASELLVARVCHVATAVPGSQRSAQGGDRKAHALLDCAVAAAGTALASAALARIVDWQRPCWHSGIPGVTLALTTDLRYELGYFSLQHSPSTTPRSLLQTF